MKIYYLRVTPYQILIYEIPFTPLPLLYRLLQRKKILLGV